MPKPGSDTKMLISRLGNEVLAVLSRISRTMPILCHTVGYWLCKELAAIWARFITPKSLASGAQAQLGGAYSDTSDPLPFLFKVGYWLSSSLGYQKFKLPVVIKKTNTQNAVSPVSGKILTRSSNFFLNQGSKLTLASWNCFGQIIFWLNKIQRIKQYDQTRLCRDAI